MGLFHIFWYRSADLLKKLHNFNTFNINQINGLVELENQFIMVNGVKVDTSIKLLLNETKRWNKEKKRLP